MYRFIFYTFTNKSNKFSACKYNDIRNGIDDGEKTRHQKWYWNETTSDKSLTHILKCCLKFLEETSDRCITVSRLAYIPKLL